MSYDWFNKSDPNNLMFAFKNIQTDCSFKRESKPYAFLTSTLRFKRFLSTVITTVELIEEKKNRKIFILYPLESTIDSIISSGTVAPVLHRFHFMWFCFGFNLKILAYDERACFKSKRNLLFLESHKFMM